MKKELLERVQETAFNPLLQNYRNIDITKGSLIVLGYSCPNSTATQKFVVMGKYLGGELQFAEISNSIEIVNVPDTTRVLEKFYEEDVVETADWWRTPTDDEVELYYSVFKDLDVENDFNKLIKDIENDVLSNNEIVEGISDLRDIVVKMLR